MLVEELAQRLHLRQDEAPLRRLDVLRHHEQHGITLAAEVPRDGAQRVVLRQQARDLAAKRLHPAALPRAHGEHGHARRRVQGRHARRTAVREPVRLAHDGEHGTPHLPQVRGEAQRLRVARRLRREEHERDVRLLHRALRLPHARRAELRLVVVEARRIDEYHGAQPRDLHRLVDGIRRRAGLRGDDGELLPRQRV